MLKNLHIISEVRYYQKCGIKIGKNCRFYHNNIDEGHGYLIEIGDNCIITNSIILAHDASTKIYTGKTKVGLVKIGNNCFIGMNSIILPNVKIGDNCIIGAGAIVTKDVESNSVVAGNPAKRVMSTDEFIKKHKDNMKKYPVFDVSWKKKSVEQKVKEKNELCECFGYDD